jgi:hypothetical protein
MLPPSFQRQKSPPNAQPVVKITIPPSKAEDINAREQMTARTAMMSFANNRSSGQEVDCPLSAEAILERFK